MNPTKRIIGHLYFVYGMLLFVLTMLIVIWPILLTSLLKEPKRSRWIHNIFRVWMDFFMTLVFCPILRKGRKHFKKGENYVVICNHNSLVDVPVTSPFIPGPNKTLAKAEMAKIPVFGIIYKSGSILVDRKSNDSRRLSFQQMDKSLQMGLHLCLFPEGTRNKSDEPLQKFYDGAFLTAIANQKKIIPAVISNTGKILPGKPKFWAWPHVIRFHFLEPIPVAGLTKEDIQTLKNQAHRLMYDYITENFRK